MLAASSVAALHAPAAGAASASTPALYTIAQSKAGATAYLKNCATCHAANLTGGAGPPLIGPNMVTLGKKTNLHIGEMFDYVTSNMPMNAPASLSHNTYVSILAYILHQNGYPAGSKPLTYAAADTSKVLVTSFKK